MVLVYGKGRSGNAAAELLKKKGIDFLIVDDTDFNENIIDKISEIVVSPGIPFFHRIFKIAKRKNIPVIGEVELAYRYWKGDIVAVTGTDGKSTTTKMIYDFLKEDTENIFIGGNYGKPFSEIVLESENGTAILELSSFQIYSTQKFSPDISVFLNVSSDHLNWHKRFKHYLFSKYRLLKKTKNFAVLNYDNFYTKNVCTEGKKLFFSLKELPKNIEGAYFDGRYLNIRINGKTEKIIEMKNLPIKGIHNIQNILAASLVAKLKGVKKLDLHNRIRSFEPLPYRLEFIGSYKGVEIYNDAKSTTVQSLEMAIKSFLDKKIIVIAGGINKGGDFSTLKKYRNIKKFILIGRDRNQIKSMLAPFFETKTEDNLEKAFYEAALSAEKGDVILFSPGCASFDMFKNYIDRGEKFKGIVKGLING